MVIKNKRGWVKVLEVFVSILLVTGIVILLLNKTYFRDDLSEEVNNMEISILRDIQLNESLRGDILSVSNLPVNWSDFDSIGLTGVKNKIIENKLGSIDCEAKLCSLYDACRIEEDLVKDIYVESLVISSDLESYSPRQLKLFCWEK
jgi:hypothetical protein